MNLKEHLSSKASRSSESPSTTPPSPGSMFPRATGAHTGIAIISAIVGLFIFPEIFDTVVIILGAYAWKRQQGETQSFTS